MKSRDVPSEPHPNERLPGAEPRTGRQEAGVVAYQRGELGCRRKEFNVRRKPAIGVPPRLCSALFSMMQCPLRRRSDDRHGYSAQQGDHWILQLFSSDRRRA